MNTISHSELGKLDDPLVIDVRTPAEYDEDHLPGAINLPVLNNEQRDTVGTLYHRESTFTARQIGARTIAENLPDVLEAIEGRAGPDRPVAVYCWRGGMRSESLCLILDRIGYPTYRLEGGYKSYRKTVHQYFENGEWNDRFISIFSLTGCGKTRLLQKLEERGESTVDLEDAANHRGSAFGSVGQGPQPSQKAFENTLYQTMRNLESPVYIEGESRHVGALRVPATLFEEITSSPRVWMEADLDRRVEVIYEEYQWPEAREQLINHLDELRERLGHNRVDQLRAKLQEGEVRRVIEQLLKNYYDPAYENSCPPRDDFDFVLDGNDLDAAAEELLEWSSTEVSA